MDERGQEWEPGADEIDRLLRDGGLKAHFQPIVSLSDGLIVGYEALARMPAVDGRVAGPDRWLAAAERAGRRTELELACLDAALAEGLPAGQSLLFVNLSPSTFGDPWAIDVFDGVHDRIVLELSESQIVDDYEELRRHMWDWTSRGARLAIDDTGSGYASLRHVLQLRPDFIKLDRSLINGIEFDRHRRALADALVAFAHGLGADVIAEGVEQAAELAALRDTGIGLAQGYLLARPGPAWPAAADPTSRQARGRRARSRADLDLAVHAATDPQVACDLVVSYLAELGDLMPSAYLLRGDRLRCQAQRGIWQVLDGMAPGAGITGRCFVEGREILVQDVTASKSYLEAIPGVRAEICVPLRVEGVVVGALNVEARCEITDAVIAEVRDCAEMLGGRLGVIGRAPVESPLDQMGFHVHRIAEAESEVDACLALIEGACRLLRMNSAGLTRLDGAGEEAVALARGPLRDTLLALRPHETRQLAGLVNRVTSCYTSGTTLDRGVVGLEGLRRTGARSLAVVPLVAGGLRRGLLVVAHTSATSLTTRDVEPLELLAAQAAGRLKPLSAADGRLIGRH
jgi:EAL domain-containing protein (putative c-di-GMP-specific phosphodiesterase class I)/GAF domain-containing protein